MNEKTFLLKNKNLFVLAEAAGGIYNSSQLKAICEIADEEFAFVKITENQSVGFILPADKVNHAQSELAKVGVLLRHYQGQNPISPKACLGELCPYCEQDALGDAIELSSFLSEKFQQLSLSMSLSINGCSKACLGSSTDDIHLIGEKSGYKIYLGGKKSEVPLLSELLIESIPKSNLAQCISLILDIFSREKEENENLFDLVERKGTSFFITALEGFQLAAIKEEAEDIKVENEITEEGLLEESSSDLQSDIAVSAGDSMSPIKTEILAEEELELDDGIPSLSTKGKVLDNAKKEPILTEDPLLVEEETATDPLLDAPIEETESSLSAPEAISEDLSNETNTDVLEASTSEESLTTQEEIPDEVAMNDLVSPPPLEENENILAPVSVISEEENIEAPKLEDGVKKSTPSAHKLFSFKSTNNGLILELSGGIQLKIPVSIVQDGESLELHMNSEVIVIKRKAPQLMVSYNGLEISLTD